MNRIFGWVRFVAVLGVAASLLLSAGLYLTAAVRAVLLVLGSLGDLAREETVKTLLIAGIELSDALLVATGLLIVAIGLYSLFIGHLEKIPAWLHIDSFDSLKRKLVSVVVAALAVRFFSIVMEGPGGENMLFYGLAIAAVLLGLAAYDVASSWADNLRAVKTSASEADHNAIRREI
jgi:uncharacterized membrane protein YqhA